MKFSSKPAIFPLISLVLIGSILLLSCSTVPITGRKQLSIVPSSTMLGMSFQEYDSFLKSHKLSSNQEQTALVKRVGINIQIAVEQYFQQQKMSDQLNGYKWEFNLVESEEVNAWCMPGGKVVVYSGILPVTKTAVGLAVVLGHEIAHAIAEHGRERVSQGLLVQLGGMTLEQALSNKPEQTRKLWLTAFGVGATVGAMLPYSRVQESEADHLGLVFMAMAGYDPNEAVTFWERMSADKNKAAPPEFLSTHPSDQTRIKKIKERVPEAMQYYKKS